MDYTGDEKRRVYTIPTFLDYFVRGGKRSTDIPSVLVRKTQSSFLIVAHMDVFPHSCHQPGSPPRYRPNKVIIRNLHCITQ